MLCGIVFRQRVTAGLARQRAPLLPGKPRLRNLAPPKDKILKPDDISEDRTQNSGMQG